MSRRDRRRRHETSQDATSGHGRLSWTDCPIGHRNMSRELAPKLFPLNPMNESTNDVSEKLLDLLIVWEESRATGRPLTVVELCRDCPELADELEHEIHRLQSLDRFMFPSGVTDADAALGEVRSSGSSDRYPNLPGYEILEEIGRGGTGIVYKARQHSLNRYVAIKSLMERSWAKRGFVARLRQEAKALSLLNDPHVVQVYDVIETSEAVSLILEYVDGENLASRLNGMPISPVNAAQFALTLARTLTIVHEQGLLHRDIKPANVLISRTGEIKIADFGLVKEEGITGGLTATGDLFGSPSYMAPEQADGRLSKVSVRTDIYGMGATLYEMLTGRPPFVGASAMDTLSQVLHRDPISPRLLNPVIPRDLETICWRCLEKEQNRRFETSKELGDELERFLHGTPIHSHHIGVLERVARWCRRRPATAGLIGLSATAILACISIVVFSSVSHEQNLRTYNRHLTLLNEQLRSVASNAQKLKDVAEVNERIAKDRLYAADINRAAVAWRQEDTRELTDLLNRHVPNPEEIDRRGFEWWFLRRQATLAGALLHEFEAAVYMMCYSPDRRLLAAAGKGAIVKLIDASTKELYEEFSTDQIEVNGIAFSPDQKELATAGDDGTIRIWNLDAHRERLKIKTPYVKAFQLVYTPDGSQIVACGINPAIHAFSTQSGQVVTTLVGHTNTVETLLLGGDGNTLFSAANDQTIRIWNLNDGTQKGLIAATGHVEPMVLEQDRDFLIVGTTDGKLKSIDIRDNREIRSLTQIDRIGALALHPDGSLLATGDTGGRIRLRKIGHGGDFLEDDFQPWHAHRGGVHSLVWSTDGSRLISAGDDGRIQSWNHIAAPRTDPKRWTFDPRPGSLNTASRSSPVELGLSKRTELLWDLSFGTRRMIRPEISFSHLSISSDARFAVTVVGENSVQLYAISSDRQRPIDEQVLAAWRSKQVLNFVAFSPDSRFLVVRRHFEADDPERLAGEILLLRVPTLELVDLIPIQQINHCVISPDGRQILFGTLEHLILWNVTQRRIVWKLPQTNVRQLTISPDGKLIAAATSKRIISVLDILNGQTRFQLTNHLAPVHRMQFSDDVRTLITSDVDGTVKFTHVATGQELLEFPRIGILDQIEFVKGERQFVGQIFCDSPHAPREVLIFDGTNPEDVKIPQEKETECSEKS